MQNAKTYLALTFALILGTVMSLITAGCQPANPPSTPQRSSGSTTTRGSSAPAAEPKKEEPKKEEAAPAPKTEEPKKEEPKKEEATPPAPAKDAPAKEATKDAPAKDTPPAKEGDAAGKTSAADPAKPAIDPAKAVASAAGTAAAAGAAAAGAKDGAPSKLVPKWDKSINAPIKPGDWAQWGGTSYRNNTPIAKNVPIEWNPGEFDRKTGDWKKEKSKNIKWVATLGSQTYGNPVIAAGKVYVGTNNSGGFVKRYPSDVDLGVLVCFNEADGKFLWQHSSEKLPTGRVHDWPMQGICCSPYAEGNRLWFVTSRGEVRCLDAEGFYDNEDDGPVIYDVGRLFDVMRNEDPAKDQVAGILTSLKEGKINDALKTKFSAVGVELPADVAVKVEDEGKKWSATAKVGGADREFRFELQGPRFSAFKVISPADKEEADVIWVYDMMKELGTSQHNMCSCSITALDDILFVCTSNGVDESHLNLPAPDAPSFLAMDKNTGKVFWTDKSPGVNIHHGQWSSPTVAVLGGVPQVLFGGGDGWLYSFKADKGKDGAPELLWKADLNPKDAKLILGGRGTRNDIIGTPVIYDGMVYVAVGQDPEHGEGIGHLYCIDPTKRGDVSENLAIDRATGKVIPHKRVQAVVPEDGEAIAVNPNSAIIWRFSTFDRNKDGKIDFDETMHRTCGTVAIQNDLIFVADFSGLFHCVDAKTGEVYWAYDMLAAAWGSPLIADGHVYVGDEDGDLVVFDAKKEPHDPIFEVSMINSIYSTPVVANGVLYISNKDHLFAIQAEEKK